MSFFKRFFYRLRRFEYWPFSIFYIPVYFYYIWLSIKHRSFFFFTSSNPGIEFGGMLGEKKSEIFDLIPDKWIPGTIFCTPESSPDEVMAEMKSKNLDFPVICKPDIGERGWMVEKIKNKPQLDVYLNKISVPFLIQEYIDLPVELGVFYLRKPSEKQGRVTSVVQKDFLSVTGDGRSTVFDLLQKNPRALLNFRFESEFYQGLLKMVPQKNQVVEVESIGNHCRGTHFINLTDAIPEELNLAMDHIAKQIPGFYFGRFDLRCKGIKDLSNGNNFKILELNGAGSEPAHIYEPGYSIVRAYREIMWHLKKLAEISSENKNNGHKYWTFYQGLKKLWQISRYNRTRE